MPKAPAPALDGILANTAWIRRLARRLVADAAERDEVVQQVWLAALTQAPRADELRPWLAGVLRNVARMRLRGGERRRRREQRAESAAPPTPEELVGRCAITAARACAAT
jgi:DNA-directed RNA polymerase specialized sigma24 family protein